jgi:hypothetical protein
MGFQADIRRTTHLSSREPMACDACGAVYPRRDLDDLQVCTLRGIAGLDPGRCEPAEYAAECPECGARDSFQPAVRCAECDQRPCTCLPDTSQPPAGDLERTRGDFP